MSRLLGTRQGDTLNSFKLPGYVRVDAGLTYTVTKRIDAGVTVENRVAPIAAVRIDLSVRCDPEAATR